MTNKEKVDTLEHEVRTLKGQIEFMKDELMYALISEGEYYKSEYVIRGIVEDLNKYRLKLEKPQVRALREVYRRVIEVLEYRQKAYHEGR